MAVNEPGGDMATNISVPRAQTIVRQVSGSGGEERFCIVHETPMLPVANAVLFTGAGGACTVAGVTLGEAGDVLIAAGISEPDVYRLLDEARTGYRQSAG